jgi:hypothetical protein
MEGVGGVSAEGGGETSDGTALANAGSGSGGIAVGRFIGSFDCNDSALPATDTDDGSPCLLLAVVLSADVLLAVVGASPAWMRTALLIRAKPMLGTFSPSLVRGGTALPASRCVWEPDG